MQTRRPTASNRNRQAQKTSDRRTTQELALPQSQECQTIKEPDQLRRLDPWWASFSVLRDPSLRSRNHGTRHLGDRHPRPDARCYPAVVVDLTWWRGHWFDPRGGPCGRSPANASCATTPRSPPRRTVPATSSRARRPPAPPDSSRPPPAPAPWTSPPWPAPGAWQACCDDDNDVPHLLAGFGVPVRLGHLLEWEAPVDDRGWRAADRGRRAPCRRRSGGRPGGAHDPSYRWCQDSPVAPSSTWTRVLSPQSSPSSTAGMAAQWLPGSLAEPR